MTSTFSSTKKEPATHRLPVGKYILVSDYNQYHRETPFEIKTGEVTKLHVVFGQTARVQISASETEGGKPVEAHHDIYQLDDAGEKGTRMTSTFSSTKKKPAVHRLPVGKYVLESDYNEYHRSTLFEIKANETTQVNVIFGNTGEITTSASETEGGKWVEAAHNVYENDDGKAGDRICGPYSYKKRTGKCKLPVGKYILKSSHNRLEKITLFEVKAGETTKVHVVFSAIILKPHCSTPNGRIHYEIYASNGQMVHEENSDCNQKHKVVLDAGSYTLEATTQTAKSTQKITAGSGTTKTISVDLTQTKTTNKTTNKPATHVEEKPSTPQTLDTLNQTASEIIEASKGSAQDHAEDIKKVGQMLEALGGLFGGKQTQPKATNTGKRNPKPKASNGASDKEFEEMSKDLDMFTK
jgi:hypothetical protein